MNKKKIISLLLIFLYLPQINEAQKTTLLKGTIGKYPVIMELDVYGDTAVNLIYFYKNIRKNVNLEGTINKEGSIDAVRFNNYEEKFDSTSEQIELKKVNEKYIGKWTTTKRILPVRLIPFLINKFPNPYKKYSSIKDLVEQTPLDYIRIAGLYFIKDSTTNKSGFYLDWYHERYSHIILFRLRKDSMTQALKRVNEQLKEIQLLESNYLLSCSSTIGETEFEQRITNIFLNNDILSINLFTNYYCGGAHPDFGSSGSSFNLHTGSKLHLDDLLNFGKYPKEESNEWLDYRGSVFAPKIISILKELYPMKMKKPISQDDCDYTDADVWSFPNWYFTKEGLYIGAYFARVQRECDEPEWSVIPYKIIKKYMINSLKIKLP